MRIYKSKVDLWFKLMTAGLLLVPMVFGAFIGREILPGLVICGLIVVFILWLYLATKYEITEDELIINAGLYKVIIPLQSISSVTESNSLEASPAFSLDRLEIKYGQDKMILISPKDKAAFLGALKASKA